MEILGIAALFIVGYILLRRDIQSIKPKKRASPKKTEGDKEQLVYIIANPSYRTGLFKIGLTTRDVGTRMGELHTTGVPTPFVKCVVLKAVDCKALEKYLHRKYRVSRINPKREWFNLTDRDIKCISEREDETMRYEVMYYDDNAIRSALGLSLSDV